MSDDSREKGKVYRQPFHPQISELGLSLTINVREISYNIVKDGMSLDILNIVCVPLTSAHRALGSRGAFDRVGRKLLRGIGGKGN
jgi:hypothetical protein